jgi:hypothetical protein
LEIIIYRQLLEACGIEVPSMTVVPRTQTQIVGNGMRKVAIKRQKKGPIGISKYGIENEYHSCCFFVFIEECAPNGTYISLMNYSTNKNIDISRWMLTRQIDSIKKLQYTVPDGIRLVPDGELRIYAKLNGSGGGGPTESISYQKLINNNLTSWGM